MCRTTCFMLNVSSMLLLYTMSCPYHCVVFDHVIFFFFFKQKTAYEMRISDWSSDVCSSDLAPGQDAPAVELVDVLDRQAQRLGAEAGMAMKAVESRQHGRAVATWGSRRSTSDVVAVGRRDRHDD